MGRPKMTLHSKGRHPRWCDDRWCRGSREGMLSVLCRWYHCV